MNIPYLFSKDAKMFLLLTVTVNSQRKFSNQHFLCRKLYFCTTFYGPDAKTRCHSTRCHWTTPLRIKINNESHCTIIGLTVDGKRKQKRKR